MSWATTAGINATSFCLVRRPEDSPGIGHGYKTMLDIDYSKTAGKIFDIAGEAIVLRDGQQVEVSTAELVVGDLLLIRPGSKVPVDATVEDGEPSQAQQELRARRELHRRWGC